MKELFLIAGEQSGDVLGAKLIDALKKYDPSFCFSGVGGKNMQASGMQIVYPMNRFQVMGISDVLKALPRLFHDMHHLKKTILSCQPAATIFIDYPDFNMHLAKMLRKKGYKGKLFHYVCPSVWAWRKKRIKTLANTLDGLLSILPFEKDYFCKTTLPVTYVGHPLVSAIDQYSYDLNYHIPTDKPILALFPGSRAQEIELNLPIQWQVAQQFKQYTPVISVARVELLPEITKYVGSKTHIVFQEKRYELMQQASLALATSGTVVLELGLHAVPTVVTYRLASLNYLAGRYFFRILLPFYTLVNIILEGEVFPEFIHKNLSVQEIVNALKTMEKNREICQKQCKKLKMRLSQQDASEKAAKIIYEMSLS